MTDTDVPVIRIGDAERTEARRLLNEHLSAGRLTAEEFGDRAVQAEQARTREDLRILFRDLPTPQPVFESGDQAPSPNLSAPPVPSPAGHRYVSARHKKRAAISVLVPFAGLGVATAVNSYVIGQAGIALVMVVIVAVVYLGLTFADRRGRRD